MKDSSTDRTLKELEQRKERLRAELNQHQFEIDDSLNRVKKSVTSNIDPTRFIRKKPFRAVSIAIIAGFVAGLRGKRKKGQSRDFSGITTHAVDELKRIAARRAVNFFIDTIDENFVKKNHPAHKDRDEGGR